MEYLENFKSRFESYYKSREVPKTREIIVENILTTRRTTRAQLLTERRNILDETLSPSSSSVLMVSAKKQQKSPSKKMDRLARMKLWKAEKMKKMEEQKSKTKPLFKVGAKANIGFPNINDTKQIIKKSFAPSNHIFKAPVNVKAIEFIAVKKTIDTFKRVTRSQKAAPSSPLSLPVRSRKKLTKNLKTNEPREIKVKSKLTRQNAFDGIFQVNEQNTKMKKVYDRQKENIYDVQKIIEPRSKRRSFGMNVENNNKFPEKSILNEEISKKTTSSKRKSIQKNNSEAENTNNGQSRRKSFKKNTSNEDNKENDLNSTFELTSPEVTNKGQSRRKSLRKSTSNADNENDLNNTFELINLEPTPIATSIKSKRRSLRSNVANNKQSPSERSILKEKTSKKRTSSKRKSDAGDNAKKETPNKRKSNRKSTSNTDKESDLNSTYELVNPEDQITPVKDDVFSPVAAYISPFVTTSRGKGSIKKENKERSVRGLPSFTEFNAPDEEANSSFQIAGASYFHTILNNEISRLTSMCKTWDTYKEDSPNLPEDAKDLIDVAVGQANLLMNKKFQQFRKLIVSCENGYGEEKPVTCEDLQGFWDMIYIQVENLNKRFNRLSELKNHNWQEIIPVVQQKIVKKVGNKKRVKSAATSSIRAAIEAARKKTKSASSIEDTVFNGGFFVVKSPQKKTQTPETTKTKTPAKDRRSLLKSVLSSETRKSNRKSISSPGVNMMKASQTAKSIENLNFTMPTPGKSILKKTSKRKSIAHSSKAVLFKDYDSDAE